MHTSSANNSNAEGTNEIMQKMDLQEVGMASNFGNNFVINFARIANVSKFDQFFWPGERVCQNLIKFVGRESEFGLILSTWPVGRTNLA